MGNKGLERHCANDLRPGEFALPPPLQISLKSFLSTAPRLRRSYARRFFKSLSLVGLSPSLWIPIVKSALKPGIDAPADFL